MRGVAVPLVVLLAGAILLAGLLTGCLGTPADQAKATYPRTAIPPGGEPKTGADPRLSIDGLRRVDPCSLLDTTVLAKFGTPADNVAQDFDACRNFMVDRNGESLAFSILVGETLTNSDVAKATERIADFRTRVSTVEGACFVVLVVGEDDPPVGVALQASYEPADPCPPAREVAASVGERLRSSAALRTPKPGSLIGSDTCQLAGSLPEAAVPGATDPDPYGLHQCTWANDDGVELELQFAYRLDPAKVEIEPAPVPVDLGGGVTGHQYESDNTFAKCELGWLHLLDTADQGDVVDIEVRDIGDTGIDVCAAAVTFAKGLVPRLPKP